MAATEDILEKPSVSHPNFHIHSVEHLIMTRMSWFHQMYWRHLAKPAQHRELFRFLLSHPIASVLEIGIGNGERLKQVLNLYTLQPGAIQLRYTTVDLFESGPTSDGHLKLRDVHRLLAEHGVKAHLIPGDPMSALPRVVQMVMPSDLVIIDSGFGEASSTGNALSQWLPRLTHEKSTVFARGSKQASLARVEIPSPSIASRAA